LTIYLAYRVYFKEKYFTENWIKEYGEEAKEDEENIND
jgi:hypothetical protein